MPTNDPIRITLADTRRAAVLISHFGQSNGDGVQAIMDEAIAESRALPLLFAVLALYDEIVPELRSELGMKLMSSTIMKLAVRESAS